MSELAMVTDPTTYERSVEAALSGRDSSRDGLPLLKLMSMQLMMLEMTPSALSPAHCSTNRNGAIRSAGVKRTSAGVSTTEVYADAGGQTDILGICEDLMGGQTRIHRPYASLTPVEVFLTPAELRPDRNADVGILLVHMTKAMNETFTPPKGQVGGSQQPQNRFLS